MNKTRRRKRARRHRASQLAYMNAWLDELMASAEEVEPGVFMVEFGGMPDDDGPDEHWAVDDIPF